ncbi:hypothetical protein SM124_11500 [Bacillus sp. 31A1R]|uniref:Uncharacterized protein n=1 Tax=Robertmurraya mangrovi TaxID=3098077 RepID=A0ABU5IYX8_9BACI|nr:hypothetical protein [Bacillus sp. 31A1R]MDZ5472373.1 hypothetical protein [Bacillus sp. 31A1R]
MGLTCSCGFIIPGLQPIGPIIVVYFDNQEQRLGSITYLVNVCAEQMEQSFVNFSFDDNSGLSSDRSFSFESSQIREVICNIQEGNCVIDVLGDGLITGETEPRPFRVTLTLDPDLETLVVDFAVSEYAFSGFAQYLQEDVTTFGCDEVI